jgi:hypothetical protein
MSIIVGGFVFVVIGFVAMIVVNIIKATKDPDVIEASKLRMDVNRYKKYKEWYDEHQRLMRQYGIGSKEEQKYFMDFFRKIKNPNEWRRYQEYRYKGLNSKL